MCMHACMQCVCMMHVCIHKCTGLLYLTCLPALQGPRYLDTYAQTKLQSKEPTPPGLLEEILAGAIGAGPVGGGAGGAVHQEPLPVAVPWLQVMGFPLTLKEA